jgi:inhibitor of KinA
MNSTAEVRFLPAGDRALVVDFGDRVDRSLSAQVVQLSEDVRALKTSGVVTTVPTFRSLLVHYDPLRTSGASLAESIRGLLNQPKRQEASRKLWRLPACYAPQFAPDLADVAERTGLSVDDVVARHSAVQFHVYMVGFLPGFPYMGDLPVELHLPRRIDPRVRVPAGSVAIATSLTAVYVIESPGGWHLIGSTPVKLFDAAWERPSLFAPGDQVRFDPVGVSEYERIRAAAEAGEYCPICEDIAA